MSSGRIFIVGVGPGSLPFMSVHAAALSSRGEYLFLDANLPENVKNFISLQCKSKKEACVIVEVPVGGMNQPEVLTAFNQWNGCGEALWYSRVEKWGEKVGMRLDINSDKLSWSKRVKVIYENLPEQENGGDLLLIERKRAFRFKSCGQEKKVNGKGLSGKRVVVTRAKKQLECFAETLRSHGAKVILAPSIRTEPHPEREGIIEAIAGLNSYDWVVFSSTNGVDMFVELFFRRFKDMREFGGARIAAVGPATAARIESFHLQVDVIPREYTGKAVANAIGKIDSLENRKILLVRPEKGSADLPKLMEEAGAIVDDIPFYRTIAEEAEEIVKEELETDGADWVTFCSPSAVRHFNEQYGLIRLKKLFPELKIASIGPETTSALTSLGLRMTVEASPYTIGGLIKAMERQENAKL